MSGIEQATRNAKVLKWLRIQDSGIIGIMREYYADFLSVPVIETNNEFSSTEELDWVYTQFSPEINSLFPDRGEESEGITIFR